MHAAAAAAGKSCLVWNEHTHTRTHDIMENGIYEKKGYAVRIWQNVEGIGQYNIYMHARTHAHT